MLSSILLLLYIASSVIFLVTSLLLGNTIIENIKGLPNKHPLEVLKFGINRLHVHVTNIIRSKKLKNLSKEQASFELFGYESAKVVDDFVLITSPDSFSIEYFNSMC